MKIHYNILKVPTLYLFLPSTLLSLKLSVPLRFKNFKKLRMISYFLMSVIFVLQPQPPVMRRKSNNDESFDVCGNASEVQPSKHQLKKERRQARKERKRQKGSVAAREQSSNAKESADTQNGVESGQFLWLVGCCWSVCSISRHCPSLGVKCLGHGADHSLPSSAKLRMSGAIPLLQLYGLLDCIGTIVPFYLYLAAGS
jgi:hypothetical protein